MEQFKFKSHKFIYIFLFAYTTYEIINHVIKFIGLICIMFMRNFYGKNADEKTKSHIKLHMY